MCSALSSFSPSFERVSQGKLASVRGHLFVSGGRIKRLHQKHIYDNVATSLSFKVIMWSMSSGDAGVVVNLSPSLDSHDQLKFRLLRRVHLMI